MVNEIYVTALGNVFLRAVIILGLLGLAWYVIDWWNER